MSILFIVKNSLTFFLFTCHVGRCIVQSHRFYAAFANPKDEFCFLELMPRVCSSLYLKMFIKSQNQKFKFFVGT